MIDLLHRLHSKIPSEADLWAQAWEQAVAHTPVQAEGCSAAQCPDAPQTGCGVSGSRGAAAAWGALERAPALGDPASLVTACNKRGLDTTHITGYSA